MTIYRHQAVDARSPEALAAQVNRELERIAQALELHEAKLLEPQEHRIGVPADGGSPADVPELARAGLGSIVRARAAAWVYEALGGFNQWARIVSRLYCAPSAYVGLTQATPVVYGTLGAAWTRLQLDTADPIPRFALVDPATNSWAYQFGTLYVLAITLQLSHNSSNSGRSFNIRIAERDGAGAGPGWAIGIGRNVTETNVSLLLPALVGEGQLIDRNEYLVLDIGGGDSITSVTMNQARVLSWAIGVTEVP